MNLQVVSLPLVGLWKEVKKAMLPTFGTLLQTPEGLLGSVIAIGLVLERLTRLKKKKAYRKKFR